MGQVAANIGASAGVASGGGFMISIGMPQAGGPGRRRRSENVRGLQRPIAIKLFAGFFVMIIVASVIAFVSIGRLAELGAILRDLPRKDMPEIQSLWNIKVLLSGMNADIRHVLLDDDRQRYIGSIRERNKAIESEFVAYRDLHPRPAEWELRYLGEATSRYKTLQEATGELLRLIQGDDQAAARELLLGAWEKAHQTAEEGLNLLFLFEGQEMEHRVKGADSKNLEVLRLVSILATLAILLSLALALGISMSLTRPIARLVEATERVTRGDLESRAEVGGSDEIGMLAQRFNEMLDRLNKSISDQSRFYADVSHELRTPLTVIRGEAEVALRGPGAAEDYREALQSIIAVAHQLGQLVDELLFLARSEAGEIRYEMASVALSPLLEEAAGQSEGVARLKGVGLGLELANPVTVWGDVRRLRQLALILLDNAIKYTETGGTVTLALELEPDRSRMRVRDTGVGIADRDLPHVFERFYRGSDPAVASMGGTGLGLSIARSIVEAHDGEIHLDSAVGSGTTVTVSLPRAVPQGR